MDSKIQVFRPERQVIAESRGLQRQAWETHVLSVRGMVDHLGGLVHQISGGRVGRPSIQTRASIAFAENVETISARFHAEMAEDGIPPKKTSLLSI